jgi:hypothetical protein
MPRTRGRRNLGYYLVCIIFNEMNWETYIAIQQFQSQAVGEVRFFR